MTAKKRRRKRKKKIEASKKLAYWAAIVASLSAATSYLLSAFGRDPVSEVTGTIFTAWRRLSNHIRRQEPRRENQPKPPQARRRRQPAPGSVRGHSQQ